MFTPWPADVRSVPPSAESMLLSSSLLPWSFLHVIWMFSHMTQAQHRGWWMLSGVWITNLNEDGLIVSLFVYSCVCVCMCWCVCVCVCGGNFNAEQSVCRRMQWFSCVWEKEADVANEWVMEEWWTDRLGRERRERRAAEEEEEEEEEEEGKRLTDKQADGQKQADNQAGWSAQINTSTCTVWIMTWF